MRMDSQSENVTHILLETLSKLLLQVDADQVGEQLTRSVHEHRRYHLFCLLVALCLVGDVLTPTAKAYAAGTDLNKLDVRVQPRQR